MGLGDAVWDAVSHALLPYMVIVDQPPVPESERRTGAVTIYHNLWTTMHKKEVNTRQPLAYVSTASFEPFTL